MLPSLVSLREAYQDFSDVILALADARFLASMNGWSPRDIVAHLIGWNRGMIEAAGEILDGKTPAYYADAPTDYRNINAGYVARYASRSRSELLAELASSLDAFERYIRALDPSELDNSHGVLHYSGRPATVAGIIASLAGDYRDHAAQIRAWLRVQS